jgi:hypothetical protein
VFFFVFFFLKKKFFQFASRGIDLQMIREQHLDKLLSGLENSPSLNLLTEMIESYKNFSSVEEV